MNVLQFDLGRDSPPAADHGARSCQSRRDRDRGINGGDPRFAGSRPFMPRKPVGTRLIASTDVIYWEIQASPPSLSFRSLLSSSPYDRQRRPLNGDGTQRRKPTERGTSLKMAIF